MNEEMFEHIPGRRDSIDVMAVLAKRQRKPVPVPRVELPPTVLVANKQLRSYQQSGVLSLVGLLRKYGGALLADEMGLGKTRQAIAAASELAKDRVLVFCQRSVAETWREELKAYGVSPHNIAILGPPSSKKYAEDYKRAANAQFVVSSYELAPRLNELVDNLYPEFVIVDEIHNLKGFKSTRADHIEQWARLATYRLGISGTPFDNLPRDLWKPLQILLGNTFGTYYQFTEAYAGGKPGEHGGWEARGATRQSELRLRLSYYMVRREKRDVAKELPEITRQVRWLDPDKQGAAAFKAAMLHRKKGMLQKALQATLVAKMPAVYEIAQEAKRFLCFTLMRSHAEHMARELTQMGVPTLHIHGGMGPKERKAAAEEAIKKGWGVVATLASTGTGVNIQKIGSVGIMHGLDWRPLVMAQGEARLHRLGQEGSVIWYYLACRETMDEPVVNLTIKKVDNFRAIIGGAEEMRGLRDALEDADKVDEHELLQKLAAELTMKEEVDA